MRTTRRALHDIANSVEAMETHLAPQPKPDRIFRDSVQSVTFHGKLEPGAEEVLFGKSHDALADDARRRLVELDLAVIDRPAARVAILTVARRLKDVADASEPITGAEIQDLGRAYERIQELINALGVTTREEERQADDLIIDLLTPAPK